ncbi:MAG: transcriptional regulator NrdR, partial [Candidatus Limnocylindria bacterium]
MRCPRCEETGTRVIDSRDLESGSTIRRRRECETCSYRFTTYERAEGARLVVVKRDGSRQDFDREKLRTGLLKALQKRPVTLDRVEAALDDIESTLRARGDAEIPSTE